MDEIVFQIELCQESGQMVASWDDPRGGGITTQGQDLGDLEVQAADAVRCHFDLQRPTEADPVTLRF